MATYKVSVIVPVYNVKEYIVETMESIYNQTLKEFELILVDDESTDGTYEILEEYSKKYENIKLFRQKNSGPSVARNRGLEVATGEYVIFVDSDDLLPKDSFEYRYNVAKEKEADVLLCGTERTTDGIDRTPIERHLFKEEYKELGKNKDLLWALGPCNKIFKRSSIEGVKFPENIDYAEDQVFVMNAYINSKKIYATPHIVYYYRIRQTEGESLTQRINTNAGSVLKQVCEAWKISVNLIDEKVKDKDIAYNIKGDYFYRLMIVNIWEPLKRVLKSGDKEAELNSLKDLTELMNTVSENELNRIGKLKRMAFNDVIKNNELTDKQKIAKLKKIMLLYRAIRKVRNISRI